MATPSAPFPIARIARSVDTLPVQGTKIVRNEDGCWARIVPAMSAAPKPHFQQRKEAMRGLNSLVSDIMIFTRFTDASEGSTIGAVVICV